MSFGGGGEGFWHLTFIPLTSFVTLESYSNLGGLQFAQLKNKIGNWEDPSMGVTKGGVEWQVCEGSK